MQKKNQIWVVCPNSENTADEHIYQLLGKARMLCAGVDSSVVAVCMEEVSGEQIRQLFSYGAHVVMPIAHATVSLWDSARCLAAEVRRMQPQLLLFPSTVQGRSVAAAVSALSGAGLTAECIEITYTANNQYVFSRTALASSVIANIICINTKIQMCTVRRNVFAGCVQKFTDAIGSIEPWGKEIAEAQVLSRMEILARKVVAVSQNDMLERARLVFAFGRGLGGGEALVRLRKLARQFRAEIAGTRAVVEEGMLERTRQVGQSGISVSPKLYCAFGISGAIQHIVGIKNADCIVAVNSDKDAPIFQYANYCVVEDCNRILQEMESLTQVSQEILSLA